MPHIFFAYDIHAERLTKLFIYDTISGINKNGAIYEI